MQPIRLAQPARSDSPEAPGAMVATLAEREPVRQVLVVSGRLFRDGLKRLLTGPGMALAGTQTVTEALAMIETGTPPDLVIVVACSEQGTDDALSQIRSVRHRFADTKWLLLGESLSAQRLRQAVECGIDGFLLHDISGAILTRAAELLLLGQSLLPTGLRDLIAAPAQEAAGVASGDPRPLRPDLAVYARPASATPPIHLSERERQILDYLVKGYSNKLIARQLEIADATVKVHVKGLLRKMQVANRTQAAIKAIDFCGVAIGERDTDGAFPELAPSVPIGNGYPALSADTFRARRPAAVV